MINFEKPLFKVISGGVLAVITAGIIIYSIENSKSFLQILCGFILFIFPFIFLSSFFSRTGTFIFIFTSIMITYLVTKYYFSDFWIGVLLAFILGISIFIFKVNTYEIFSPTKYRDKLKNKFENER
tara:strand:- start:1287 stop:1664 length:378 start_codon:yes stop_codon:yes gene_type:complete